jgi:hypothetical protein
MITKYFILTLRALGAFGILFLSFILFLSLRKTLQPIVVSLVSEDQRRNGSCPGVTQTLDVKDSFMPKHFPLGAKFKLLANWYACHEVERGDQIYLRYSFKFDPVIRTVYGVPGDKFEIFKDPIHAAWNISINGARMEDAPNFLHFFGNENPPLLSLYVKSGKGVLEPKNYIVFSETSPGAFDSGTLGLVNVDDFLGKAEHSQK